MSTLDAPPAVTHLTITETADQLGVKPWEVVRLIESDQLHSVTYIPATALRTYMAGAK